MKQFSNHFALRIFFTLFGLSLVLNSIVSFGQIPIILDKNITKPKMAVAGQYIVVYKKNAATGARIMAVQSIQARQRLMREEVNATLLKNKVTGKQVLQVYETAIQGFAVTGLTGADVERLQKDDQVDYVVADTPVYLYDYGTPQPLPLAGSCDSPTPSITLNGVKNSAVIGANFGSTAIVTGLVKLVNDGSANPTLACATTPVIPDISGKIALIDRGTCDFSTKAYNAQLAGAIGVIIVNNTAGSAPGMGTGANSTLVTIPVMSMTQAAGNALKTTLSSSVDVTAVLNPQGFDPTTQCTPWGITRVGGGSPGLGNRAWIIDTGIELTHPDLNVNTSLSTYFAGTSPNDVVGHGTHVAGTVAAKNNGIGVIGVAAGAEVVSVRVFSDQGSTLSSIVIQGVNYVASHAAIGDVANMSLGGGANRAQDDAVIAMADHCRVVLAAGNEAQNANYQSPGRVNGDNIYTVSAMDITGKLASFSDYGNAPIDYSAPGVNIASCWLSGGYAYLNGTSMAAPHVAGLLLLGTICSTAKVTGDPDGNPDRIATLYIAANDVDNDGDGVTTCGGDLDDNDATVKPGATEICDNKDNNGDGQIDEGTACCIPGNNGILYVNLNASGAENGISWPGAFKSLQAALTAAKRCTQITQIWVTGGTYYPSTDEFGQANPANVRTKSFVMQNDLAIYGGFAGGETNLSQRNLSINTTILNGEIQQDNVRTNNAYHVVMNFPASGASLNNTAILDGIAVMGGYADVTVNNAPAFPHGVGSGMFNYNSNPTIRNAQFLSNTSVVGAGMYNLYSSPTVANSYFYANGGNFGGGMANEVSSPTIVNCDFRLNQSVVGGGMYNESGSNPVITNSTFSGNNATASGGGLAVVNGSSPSIKNSIIWGNGTGIYSQASNPTVTFSTIEGGWSGAGSNNLSVNPLFVESASITPFVFGDLTLDGCSPALNSGDPSTTTANAGNFDLDGNNRIFGSAIDMGSYELQSERPALVVSISPASQSVSPGQTLSLRASGALSYLWNDGSTVNPLNVSPTTTTTYTVTGTKGSCTGVASATITSNPLPVTLISFSARNGENGSVKLAWVTANEIDNAYFKLERSTDLRKIDSLARVTPDLAKSQNHTYGYTDELPYKGTSYYRLSQIDFNGRRTTYAWVSVVVDQVYTVFPNPVTQRHFRLQLDEPQNATLKFYDVNGKLVPLQTMSSTSGTLELKLPKNTPAGVYLLQVQERSQNRQYRVMVE